MRPRCEIGSQACGCLRLQLAISDLGSVACGQWPATNRKASSIVLTPAFDPSEPVSIFEY